MNFIKTLSAVLCSLISFSIACTPAFSQTPYQVKDIRSGSIGGFEYQTSSSTFSTFNFDVVWEYNNEIYFVAVNSSVNATPVPDNNWELWKSDGTNAGTVMVKDIFTGTEGSFPTDFYVWNNKLYFTADNGTNGRELWVTDGTTAGTLMVKDIRSGSVGGFEYQTGASSFSSLTFTPVWNDGNAFYFVANNTSANATPIPINNYELWKSDGTNAGTVMVKDIYVGTDGSYPINFYAWNNKLYFTADNGTNGRELWVSDGSNGGTTLVKDIRSGSVGGFEYQTGASNFSSLTFTSVWNDGNAFYFVANNTSANASPIPINNYELWKSDGTNAGTVMVKDIYVGTDGSYPINFYAWNNKLYFTADNGTNGRELWVSDGSNGGTTLVKDIRSGSVGGFEYQTGASSFSSLTFTSVWNDGNAFYFVANNTSANASPIPINNYELWKSDGTNAGTVMVKDIYVGTDGSYPINFYAWNNKLYFTADNGTNGRELWVSDGSNGGTILVKDIRSGSVGGFEYQTGASSFSSLTFTSVWNDGNAFYFVANNTSANASPIPINNYELWKSDGTNAGTVMVKDIYVGTDGSYPINFYAWNNKLYFTADNGTNGRELWVSDGSNGGTTLVKDIRSGSVGGFERQTGASSFSSIEFNVVANSGSEFYFVAINASTNASPVPINNWELWKSNGTNAGTVLVQDICPGTTGSFPTDFHVFPGRMYFSADNCTNGRELWAIDDSFTGTEELQLSFMTVYPNPASDHFTVLTDAVDKGKVLMQMTDINGRLIKEQVLESQTTKIETSDLNRGIYLVRLMTGNEAPVIKKVVVQ